MAVAKKFYWIKLKQSLMTSDVIDYMMSQPDGSNYFALYVMLCFMTLNTGGSLSMQIGETIIPFDVEKIQRDCKWFSVDTIRIALSLYAKLGLVYMDCDGILRLADFEDMVGSETSYAGQKRNQRKLNRISLEGGQKVDTGVDNVHPEIEIEYRDKSKSLELEKEKEIYPPTQPSVVCPPKGESRKFVKPSLDDVRSLCEERGYTLDPQSFLDYYDSNGWRVGKNPMKDWKAALANWQRNEKESPRAVQPRSITKGDMNYSQHDYMSSDYDWLKDDKNDDLTKYYGDGK